MSAFFDQVYQATRQIPYGCVASYGQVAAAAGRPRAARFVGYALHANPHPGTGPDAVPCHRVVFKDGSLAPGFAFGGPDAQRRLLEAEGVSFRPDGRVDMGRCAVVCFRPPSEQEE
ncbi:MGMT family protein [Eggerthellaceae bacterium zg-997]|nr:MGMT family protein [Eggerthellaceae bacterium zg-997]